MQCSFTFSRAKIEGPLPVLEALSKEPKWLGFSAQMTLKTLAGWQTDVPMIRWWLGGSNAVTRSRLIGRIR